MIRVIVVFFLLVAFGSQAQQISNLNPKVRIIEGEAYYLHRVLEGQTLEAIADAYKCSERDINKANSDKASPLEIGVTLRIPYTDQSALVMSKYDLKLNSLSSNSIYKEEEEPVIESEEAVEDIASQEKEQVEAVPEPVEEVSSVEQEDSAKETEEVTESEKEALAALSATLKESMTTLDDAQKKVEEKPVMAEDGLPKEEAPSMPRVDGVEFRVKNQDLSEFLEATVQPMIESQHSTDDAFTLKEFFLVRVNKDGVITNVRDERTETNKNTRTLEPDSLKGYRLTRDLELLDNQFQSIGLVAETAKDTYLVKCKLSGFKYLEGEPSDQEKALIEDYANSKSLFGKYYFDLVDVDYYLATYEPFEYNPFGELRQKLYFNREKRVESARLK